MPLAYCHPFPSDSPEMPLLFFGLKKKDIFPRCTVQEDPIVLADNHRTVLLHVLSLVFYPGHTWPSFTIERSNWECISILQAWDL